MKKYHIQPGEKYNRLTCVRFSHTGNHQRSYFVFRCDCGKEKTILGSLVTCGNTKSCGCFSSEIKRNKRISKNHSELTAIILGYKRHALARGFSWSLTRDFVKEIINRNCFYCGSPPSNVKKTKNSIDGGLFYSGIDRIDSTKNYTEDNVVPCCKICNYAKSNMPLNEFKEWAIKLGKKAMADQWG